jgi:hypothetical protein
VTQIDVQILSLSSLSHRCARESDQFFNRHEHDPRFCFELFRRALLERDELAWTRIYNQYERLVSHWVKRHEAFPASGEEVDFFVIEAYSRMWTGITPEKFETFDDLKSILRYLQMCVSSVLVDFVRKKEYKLKVIDTEELPHQFDSGEPEFEERIIDEVVRQKFWQLVKDQLQDEREECVVNAMFVLDLKPREVVVRFKHIFDNVQEVYRVKENLLARLGRNDALKQFLNDA